MRGDELLDILEYIDPALIERADRKPKTPWLRWTAVAACLAVVLLCIFHLAASMPARPNLPYEIVVENGISYLVMDEIENKPDNFNAQVDCSIYFSSVDEMINDIKTGNFSDIELFFISHYPKDALGRIQVCNFDNLLVPAAPAPLELTGICWNGLWFTYLLRCDGDNTVYTMLLDTKEQYEETIDFNANFANKTTCTVHNQTTEEDRNAMATYYTNLLGEECKLVYYTVGEEDSTIHIMEDYVLKGESYELEYIQINCTNNGVYFHYSAGETERPSVEWLSQFGIREYVETEAA